MCVCPSISSRTAGRRRAAKVPKDSENSEEVISPIRISIFQLVKKISIKNVILANYFTLHVTFLVRQGEKGGFRWFFAQIICTQWKNYDFYFKFLNCHRGGVVIGMKKIRTGGDGEIIWLSNDVIFLQK